MAEIFTILTQVGMREIAKAIESGNKIKFTHLAVGDGNGSLPEINDEMTSLVNEVWRGPIDGVTVGENKNEWVMLTAYVPASEGGFEIREIGAYDEKGQLLAVGTYPVIWKPSEFDGAVTELTIRMAIGISNSEAVELYFDDSAQYVTMSELKDIIDTHLIPLKDELDKKADKADLIGLATEKYVDDKISEIPEVDLTPLNKAIDSLEERKANLVVKEVDPTIEDKDYPVGQMWLNNNHGGLFILKGVAKNKALWSYFKPASILGQFDFGTQGFKINENNSNSTTAVEYVEDSAYKIPAYKQDWGDWGGFIKSIATPVVLKNGQVQYELQHDDFRKKKYDEPSNLTGEDGDVMIRIPHIYVKEHHSGSFKNVILTDKPADGFVSYTKQTEKGYNQLNWGIVTTLQHLFLLIYKHRNSQTALGRGLVDQADFKETGGTQHLPFCFGETTGTKQVKFLGIEDFWGNRSQWVDGIVVDSMGRVRIGYGNFNDAGSGYSIAGQASTVDGYFQKTQIDSPGYIAADNVASSSTGYADKVSINSDSIAFFGGTVTSGDTTGIFSLNVSDNPVNAYGERGARLCYVDENYFYIGAYLGSEIDGKLRSVSGRMPVNTALMREARALARANN